MSPLQPEDWESYRGVVHQNNTSICWSREDLFEDGRIDPKIWLSECLYRIHSAMLEVLRDSGSLLRIKLDCSFHNVFPATGKETKIGCPTWETLSHHSEKGELLELAFNYAEKAGRIVRGNRDCELFILKTETSGLHNSPGWGLVSVSGP